MRNRLITLSCTGLCLLATQATRAVDRYVPGQYATIQAAIDAADDGDVIRLEPITYAEAIDFKGKAILVTGPVPADPDVLATAVIDSTGWGTSTVRFNTDEGRNSELRRVVVTGGTGSDDLTAEAVGGGIVAFWAAPTIRECVIEGNSAVGGGGMYGRVSDALLVDCTIQYNTTTMGIDYADGGGGLNFQSSDVEVDRCVVRHNDTWSDGGGITLSGGTVSISNCLIQDNTASFGGGLYLQSTFGTVANCTVVDNLVGGTVNSGGGGRAQLGALVVFNNCIFQNNRCAVGASELRDGSGVDSVVNNSIMHNGWTGEGVNNLEVNDPNLIFRDFDGGDYRLAADTVAVDYGDNEAMSGFPLDLGLTTRVVGAAVDLGAYELQLLPDPTGACCFTDGSCQTLSANNCLASDGTYAGDDVLCAEAACPQPPATGACCLGAACSVTTESDCDTQGGTYLGDDSPCGAEVCVVPDPTGACCFTDGSCQTLTADDCLASSGTYAGDDVLCAEAACPPPPATGACCMDDGSCSVVTESTCDSAGGTYTGDDTTCGAGACETSEPQTGGCCFANGMCLSVDLETCEGVGGTFLGAGTNCVGAPCTNDPEPCPEDIDASGSVDFADLLAILTDWGDCPGCASDVDGDDVTALNDLILVLASWGPCP